VRNVYVSLFIAFALMVVTLFVLKMYQKKKAAN
jgi:hypothetical protein